MPATTESTPRSTTPSPGTVRRADPTAPSQLEGTPLLRAVEAGNVELARSLLEHGARVDVPHGILQHTPLMAAARRGNREMVELLLAHGADANAPSDGLSSS